jgi:hypothetical protein
MQKDLNNLSVQLAEVNATLRRLYDSKIIVNLYIPEDRLLAPNVRIRSAIQVLRGELHNV